MLYGYNYGSRMVPLFLLAWEPSLKPWVCSGIHRPVGRASATVETLHLGLHWYPRCTPSPVWVAAHVIESSCCRGSACHIGSWTLPSENARLLLLMGRLLPFALQCNSIDNESNSTSLSTLYVAPFGTTHFPLLQKLGE